MQYLRPVFNNRLKSQSGFVLIAAIMAVMIIIAVGFFALTVSTQDMRISSRLVGERKAMSAAESGVNEVCRTINPSNLIAISGRKIDETNDPDAEFDATVPRRDENYPSIIIPGSSLSAAYAGAIFGTRVTGRDGGYGSQASIDVGIAYAPSPSDTQQGGN